MWYSIGIKAGMFLVTLGAFLWLGWSVPVVPLRDHGPEPNLTTPAPRPVNHHKEEAFHTVNLNLATVEDLRALPGIGPVLAQRIMIQREEAGPYREPEDLLAVKGIGAKRLERLRPFLVFGDHERKATRMSRFQATEMRETVIS